jgi:hypothetical protein
MCGLSRYSKQEHLFEITLPKSTRVGHVDLKFLLQAGCIASYLPEIEVTLYRSSSNRSQHGAMASVDFKSQLNMSPNAAVSDDFLKSINAEVVCGPLDISTHVDLSAQGGTVVMTSPLLILKRGRNFYLHIKAKNVGKSEATSTAVRKDLKSLAIIRTKYSYSNYFGRFRRILHHHQQHSRSICLRKVLNLQFLSKRRCMTD